MHKATYAKCKGITDNEGEPIFKETLNGEGKLTPTLFGRDVIFTNALDPITAAADNATVAFAFRFSDYICNVNQEMGMKTSWDRTTFSDITDVFTLADGLTADDSSLVKLNKTPSA
jgi:HK97 family phage major capsid protein